VRVIVSRDKLHCPTGWSAHELALFFRAAKLLSSGGLRIETDHGLTDEGEAWLIFCNVESGDVCGHFAKMSEGYVACIPFREDGFRGSELDHVLCRFLRRRGIAWSIARSFARHATTDGPRFSLAPLLIV